MVFYYKLMQKCVKFMEYFSSVNIRCPSSLFLFAKIFGIFSEWRNTKHFLGQEKDIKDSFSDKAFLNVLRIKNLLASWYEYNFVATTREQIYELAYRVRWK